LGCAFSSSSSNSAQEKLITYPFGEYAVGVVADQADHTTALFGIFVEIDAHRALFALEQILGQQLSRFGLAHPCGADQQQRAQRFARRRQPRLDLQHHFAQGVVSRWLPD